MRDAMTPEKMAEWGAGERTARMNDLEAAKAAADPSAALDAAKQAADDRRKAVGLSRGQAASAINMARRWGARSRRA